MYNITDSKTLIKYLKYLIDFADTSLSQDYVTDNSYSSLKIEADLFNTRISNSSYFQSKLKKEISSIKLPEIMKEYSFLNTIRVFSKWIRYNSRDIDDKVQSKRRENILEFRNRLNNIYELMIAKS